jgi:hypothetical protein
MNTKINSIKIFLLCPIPDEQKPMNEYINLKKFLNAEKVNKFTKLQFSELKTKTNDTFVTFSLKELKQIFINFILIVRWKEIEKRLNLPNILYEEGSWYDSQIWEKPFSMIKNDRLISSQTIKPFLKKITFFFLIFLILLFFKLFIF